MKRLILRWILLAISVIAASAVSNALNLGFSVQVKDVKDFLVLLLGVAVLSFLNATVGRILKFLAFPLTCITLGLFSLVINAIVLMLSASLKLGYAIDDKHGFLSAFLAAFVASILISFINGVLGVFLPDDEKEE